MMMMMIVNLNSTLHSVPLQRYMSQCIVKRNVFSAYVYCMFFIVLHLCTINK